MTPDEINLSNSVLVTNDIMEGGAFIYGSVKLENGDYIYQFHYNDRLVIEHLLAVFKDWICIENYKDE